MKITLTALLLPLLLCSTLLGASKPLQIQYFFEPDCPGCKKTTALITALEKKHGQAIAVSKHDINDTDENFKAYIRVLDKFGIEETPKLLIVVKNKTFAGAEIIQRQVPPFLQQILKSGKTADSTARLTKCLVKADTVARSCASLLFSWFG